MIDHVRDHVLPAAMALLPGRMDSPEARVMLLAIGLQESRFTHRRQIRGPARGYWQFESGGVNGVVRHQASKDHLRAVCEALRYPVSVPELHDAVTDNDTLACAIARLLLWTHDKPLPADPDAGWAYYLDLWRPGRPHPGTWPGFYAQAARTIGD